MKIRRLLCLFLVPVGLLAGCGQATPPDGASGLDDDDRGAALELLAAADTSALRQAFSRLHDYAFTRRLRTEQYGQDTVIAFAERVLRYAAGDTNGHVVRVQAADTSGAFHFGLLGTFVGDDAPSPHLTDPIPNLLPDEPAYASARNRDAYRYQLLSDTLLDGRTVQRLDIQARPGEGDAQTLRYARLYIDRATRVLVALYLEQARNTVLFREQSHLYAQVRYTDGTWLPAQTRVWTQINTLFSPARQFQTSSSYDDYAAL